MADQQHYPVPDAWAAEAKVDRAGYEAMYSAAAADPDAFWLDQAKRLDWIKPPTVAGNWSFDEADFRIEWFKDGVLNASVNCLDRHLAERGDQIAIIWEPDEPSEEPRRFTGYPSTALGTNGLRAPLVAGDERWRS
ncbi:acetyl-coenzyme A synthetase N-terminal domain-containing protein, partial [Sphingomonas sp. 179-A 4D3 NHS]|uniref:acetyl-coenzyme A synthetase N-terminal domain-containing protein n=1 Tax=Sphingomonas sp. 179-A 4D3 NHS TaxID=3374291 RepID=UPI00387A2356